MFECCSNIRIIFEYSNNCEIRWNNIYEHLLNINDYNNLNKIMKSIKYINFEILQWL